MSQDDGKRLILKVLIPETRGKITVFLKSYLQTSNNVKHYPQEKHGNLKTSALFS